jgi:hypothetical protein
MNAKRTRNRGKRRSHGGRRPAAKKPVSRRSQVNMRALQAALDDKYWKIEITISDANGVRLAGTGVRPKPPPPPIILSTNRIRLAGTGVRPKPPPPPIVLGRLVNWAGRALISLRRRR